MADPMNPLPSPMRSFPWRSIVVVFGILLVIVIGTISYVNAALSQKTISAGDVEIIPVNVGGPPSERRAQLKGSFTITTVPPGQENADAIPSYGTGGACLVAEWGRFGLGDAPSCSKNSDCMNALPPDKRGDIPTNAVKWFGYCHEGEGKCWLKPGGKELCNRSPDHNNAPWAPGTYYIPINPYYVVGTPGLGSPSPGPNVYQGPIKWRVVACLNGGDPQPERDTKHCQKQVFSPRITNVPYNVIAE